MLSYGPKKKFDEWKKIWGFDMETFMVNLSKNEDVVKDPMDMMSLFTSHIKILI
jgi:hypothetical protein